MGVGRKTGQNQYGTPIHMTREQAENTSGRIYAEQRSVSMSKTAPPPDWTWTNKKIDDMLARIGKEQEEWM